MITRAAYMANDATHQEYYSQFVTDGIKSMLLNIIGRETIEESKDESFNDIPLKTWDRLTGGIHHLAPKFKAAGDGMSLSGLVCVLKAAAREIRGH